MQFALGTRKQWDGQLTQMAVGVGSFSGLLAVPLSGLGNVVGNAVTKVLVRGLGDEIDAAVLTVAAAQAVVKHAELYPVSSIARFADVVAKSLDDYTGTSVRAMWAARFGHGLGESLEEGLTEMLGEAGYAAISGQGAQWNPFSFTAGMSEAVGPGLGNLAGLAVRGELTPAGRARDAVGGEKGFGNAGIDTSGELKTGSDSQTGEKSDFLSEVSGVDSDVSVPGSEPVHAGANPGPASVAWGAALMSVFLPAGADTAKEPRGGVSGAPQGENGEVAKETAAGLSSFSDTPPVSPVQGPWVPDTSVATHAGGAATSSGVPRGVDTGAAAGQDVMIGARETRTKSVPPAWHEGEATVESAQDRPGTPPPPYGAPQVGGVVHSD
ncbi:hypothetical protein [Saccharopolyspora phatthalungensis]|uniref:PPE family domain-containing protein n=1 Tax=Saccharopolyspora phatthalungensis TaxID=664693 RepID=A0A840Q758_9PSEU|nr:hypothetical protein [Saccharopolyspora phatthalungensis]MBB5156504.1 hypothetical protein [Saccharopolyspora phatthalungensis]